MTKSYRSMPNQTSSWLAISWLTERERHGSPGSARPGAAAPSLYQVHLVCLVDLVCVVFLVYWLNETNHVNQIS